MKNKLFKNTKSGEENKNVIDHYTVTITFRDGQVVVHKDIREISVADGLVGIYNHNTAEKWVYPIDTIKNYYFKGELSLPEK